MTNWLKYFAFHFLTILTFGQTSPSSSKLSKVDIYYSINKGNDSISQSIGNVSDGKLLHGELIPFKGNNFHYFDTLSYLCGRAFLNKNALKIILSSYQHFEMFHPERRFVIMEGSNKNGGKIFFHNTHQNGLSVDFMTPLIKNKKPFYEFDTLGATIYKLNFDSKGKYINDTTISIDFELIAEHILTLDSMAQKVGMRISKVIFNTELKKYLYSTSKGKSLMKSGIYIVKKLTPTLNLSHDDHYHIDFGCNN